MRTTLFQYPLDKEVSNQMQQLRKAFLPCKITQGIFDDERIVVFTVRDTTYQTIADREDVEENQEHAEDGWVEGRLQVYVVEENEERVLMNLPREATGNGRRLSVPPGLLQSS